MVVVNLSSLASNCRGKFLSETQVQRRMPSKVDLGLFCLKEIHQLLPCHAIRVLIYEVVVILDVVNLSISDGPGRIKRPRYIIAHCRCPSSSTKWQMWWKDLKKNPREDSRTDSRLVSPAHCPCVQLLNDEITNLVDTTFISSSRIH